MKVKHIIGKIASVKDEYTVILNKGADDGLEADDTYYIAEIGDMVIDPDTGAELERVEIIKGFGKISHLQPKVSTLKSNDLVKVIHPKTTITKRNNPLRNDIYKSLLDLYSSSEQIEETAKTTEEIRPFNNPKVGDIAFVYRESK